MGDSVLAMEDALRLTSWLDTGFTCFTGFTGFITGFPRFTRFDVPKQDILRTFLTLNG